MERLGTFLIAHPKTVLFALVIVAFAAVYPAMNIRTDFNLEGFYPDDDVVIQDYELLEEEFGRDDNAMLIGFKTDSLFTQSVLEDLYNIVEKLKNIEQLEEVISIWQAQQIRSSEYNLQFSPYIQRENLENIDLKKLKTDLTNDPFVSGFLINKEGNATSIVLQIEQEKNTYPNRNQIINQLEEILGEYSADYEFHTSGIPYFRNQYVNFLNGEIVAYIAISSILIILLLWYLYRTIWGILFPMIIVWTTLLFTIAIMQLTGGYLEIMSSTIAPILLCVGVADAIHMISKYDDARQSGLEKNSSIIEMLKTLGNATFLTSVTTAIGFASLISSTVMPMQKFGIYTAIGVLTAYLITIIFLPAALSFSRKKRVVNEQSGSLYPYLLQWLTKLSALNRIHYRKVLLFASLITLIFAIGMKNIDVNGKIFDDIGEDTKLMKDSRFFSENISPQFNMEFLIDTGEPENALKVDMMQRISLFEDKLLSYDEISRVSGLHTLMKEINKVMSDLDEPVGLPETDQAVAQFALLMEINEADQLYNLVDFDYRKLRVTAFVEDAGSKRINQIRDELNSEIESLFPDENIIVTGTTILSADLTEKIVYSLAWSIIIALIAITMIMALLFKTPKMVIIALVPNVLPLIIVAGVMGFMNVDIKPSTAVIFTIALGIAVDDSIHYLARFRIEYLRTRAMFPALTATTVRTGRALIITSLILIAGFGTLITSAFTSTAMMGILVCTTILSALIADLFVLPSLFYLLKPTIPLKTKSSESQ